MDGKKLYHLARQNFVPHSSTISQSSGICHVCFAAIIEQKRSGPCAIIELEADTMNNVAFCDTDPGKLGNLCDLKVGVVDFDRERLTLLVA